MQCQLLTPIILMLTLKIDKWTAYFYITNAVQRTRQFCRLLSKIALIENTYNKQLMFYFLFVLSLI